MDDWYVDLYCGVGGITKGLQRAGFRVLGVDIEEQPDYCGDEFIQGDAIKVLKMLGRYFSRFHASPPCQRYTTLTLGTNQGNDYPDLVGTTREALMEFDGTYIIENVPSAPLRQDLLLCGEMFGDLVIRHRIFEISGFDVPQPKHVPHRGRVAGYRHGEWFDGPYYAVYGDGGGKGSVEEWRIAMGIDWTWNRKSIAEAIPPSYGEYIARYA